MRTHLQIQCPKTDGKHDFTNRQGEQACHWCGIQKEVALYIEQLQLKTAELVTAQIDDIDSGNLVDDPLYKALDELYARGWRDNHKERDYDPRGTKQWQLVLDLFRNYINREKQKDHITQNRQSDAEVKARAIKDFVSSMIAALESGFVDTSTITLAQIHRVMQNHVKDNYGVDLPHITEEWGNEVAELCGFDVVGGRLSQKAKDGSRPPTPPRPPVKPVG